MRPGLISGVNVDRVDIRAGIKMGRRLGYVTEKDVMVVTYALQRWARGEEDGADRTWLAEYPNDLTSWRMIIAAAVTAADAAARRTKYRFVGRRGDRYYWEGPRVDSRIEEVSCDIDYFWGRR